LCKCYLFTVRSEKGTKIFSESLKDDKSNVYYEMPLDLTVKNRIRNQEINFYKQPLINFMPTSSTKNLSFSSLNFHQSDQMISDPLISSTTREINASKELKNNFGFSNERLKFFITKNNIYNILTQKLNADNSSQFISSMRKNLLISNMTMLNAKIDVAETIANLYFKNLTETINFALL
jgi:hypothetical protein